MNPPAASLLTRRAAAAVGAPGATPPTVRIVHLGLGAFHRAHQAWYTHRVDAAGEWGIASFTGRSPQAAAELAPQGGLFTLIERSATGDTASVITSIAEAVDGSDLARLVALLAAPTTAIITLTITEAGYRLTPAGEPNATDEAVTADLAWLKRSLAAGMPTSFEDGPTTSLGRLVLGLEARRLAGAGPIAVVPCDNMPDNGAFVARGIAALAAEASAELAGWIAETVSFVSTSVDRITPRTTPEDLATAERLTGWRDHAAVVTEPFSDWVLSGDFPAGRPAWELAGARFVDDIEPFERRKLWLLNGAHSLLAYTGLLRGHASVASAMADATCRAWVEGFWNEAEAHLPAEGLDIAAYRAALIERFNNARIEHKLAQISSEGISKLRVRIVPTVLAERAAGRGGAAGLRAIGSWLALVIAGTPMVDGESAAIGRALGGDDPVVELLRLVDPRLADDGAVVEALRAIVLQDA